MGRGNLLKWFTLPPIIAAGTVFLARLLGGETRMASVDLAVWTMAGISFIILSWLYGLFIIHGFPGLLALQCVTQGMLFCLLSLDYGARMVPWVGVIMTVSGAAALVTDYHRAQMRGVQAEVRSPEVTESRLPVPFAVTDDKGDILSVSDAMLRIAGLTRQEVDGESITALLTPGEETVELGGRTWEVRQEPMPGDRYFFQLEEERPESAPASEAPAPAPEAPALLDPITHLHPLRYALFRLDEELYRARRYEHPLSALLFRFVFPEAAEQDGTALEAFSAYCGVLKGGLRASDTAALADPRTFLFALPECPASSLEAVVQRLFSFADALCPTYSVLYDVTPLHVSVSFEGTEELPTAKTLLERLTGALAQKYSPAQS